MSNEENKNNKLCPLISERKIVKEFLKEGLESVAVMKYNQKDLLILGYNYSKFEIYDSTNFELLAKNPERIDNSINNGTQLSFNTFAIICQSFIFIYLLSTDYDSVNNKENYHVALIQTIKFESKDGTTYSFFGLTFSRIFLFDKDLYREKDDIDMEIIDQKENADIFGINNELLVSATIGIVICKRKEPESEDTFKNMDINSYIKYRTENKYVIKAQITDLEIYDMVQVNYNVIAGTTSKCLCLFSVEKHELITKIEAEISDNCDHILYMLNKDLLCLGGGESISLFSIKDYQFIFTCLVKSNYRVSEICILPDYNILVAIDNYSREYFYQYKCVNYNNEATKKKKYKLEEVSNKLMSHQRGNASMKCLSNNKLVIAIDNEKLQIWE